MKKVQRRAVKPGEDPVFEVVEQVLKAQEESTAAIGRQRQSVVP